MEFFNIEMDTELTSSWNLKLMSFFGLDGEPSPKGSAAKRATEAAIRANKVRTVQTHNAWGR